MKFRFCVPIATCSILNLLKISDYELQVKNAHFLQTFNKNKQYICTVYNFTISL